MEEQLGRALAVDRHAGALGVHHAEVAARLEIAPDALAIEPAGDLDRIEPAVAGRRILGRRLGRLAAAPDRDRDHRDEQRLHDVGWYHRSSTAARTDRYAVSARGSP